MVVTELYRYLRNVDPNLRDIIIVHTKNESVVAGAKVAVASILNHYEDARVQLKELDSEDIENNTELNHFIETVIDAMIIERDKYNVNKFYLNLTGGRKIQTISLAIFAGLLGINEVYNVIDKNIQNYNAYWERSRSSSLEFNDIDNIDELKRAYMDLGEEFDQLFYPDPRVLNFLKVPIVEMPMDERNILKKLLGGIKLEEEEAPETKLKAYQNSGLLTYDRSRTYPTELGSIILKYLR
jgi:CRISPR-associated Csx14 family protein